MSVIQYITRHKYNDIYLFLVFTLLRFYDRLIDAFSISMLLPFCNRLTPQFFYDRVTDSLYNDRLVLLLLFFNCASPYLND